MSGQQLVDPFLKVAGDSVLQARDFVEFQELKISLLDLLLKRFDLLGGLAAVGQMGVGQRLGALEVLCGEHPFFRGQLFSSYGLPYLVKELLKQQLDRIWQTRDNVVYIFPLQSQSYLLEHFVVESLPVDRLGGNAIGLGVVVEFNLLGEVIVEDLGHHDAVGEVPVDVFLGLREGDAVDGLVDLLQLVSAQRHDLYYQDSVQGRVEQGKSLDFGGSEIYHIFQKSYFEMLNQKDLVIHSLQSQLEESQHSAEELLTIHTQLQALQHRYSLLQNQHLNSKCLIQSKVEASDKTLSQLKGEIAEFEAQCRDKSAILMEHAHEMVSLKDQKVARDNQAEMLRYEAEGCKADWETLTHERGKLENNKLSLDSQLREIQGDLVQLEQNKFVLTQKYSAVERQKHSFRIQAERLTLTLHNYECENDRLEKENKKLEGEEKRSLDESNGTREQLISQELLQTELQNRLMRARQEADKGIENIKFQKERAKEIVLALRNKCAYKDSLHSSIQNQQKQRNFLLQKNAQIVEINDRLKTDHTLCESHLVTLKASIDGQKELLSQLRHEDEKVAELIKNRHRVVRESRSQQKLSLSRTSTGFGSIRGNFL